VATATGTGSSTSGAPEGAHTSSRRRERSTFRLPLLLVVLAVAALAVARPLAVETFRITTGSMLPALRPGDHVVVDRLTYGFEDVRRGDVIAFEDPERPGEVAIKRVVALPGDTIAIRAGTLLVNGRQQREAYLVDRRTGDFYGPTIVPAGHLFVLGDNRSRSVDSRFIGPIPADDLLGQVVGRVWPPSRVALL
jgi:signal peptidase I